MHDPQDNCFTSKFSAFQGNQGDITYTHLPAFAMVGCGLTVTIVIKATATMRGEKMCLKCSICGKLEFFCLIWALS